jgi:EpsI family protein
MRNEAWVACVLLAAGAIYWPDIAALGRYWAGHDANAQTGVLIAALSVFLLFRARGRFEQVPIEPVPWAGLPLLACGAASLLCWRGGILTLQLFFLPAILWLVLLALLGRQAARAAGFAIGFLYFALPGWGLLGPTLQRLTAWAVGVIGPRTGLPLVMAGMTVKLPEGILFVVAPECSGVDFLTVGLAIAALQGELERAALRRRARLIGGMILLAVVSNWLRVLLIVAIGYRSHMRNALATRDHLALGWVVFACALLLFVWVAGRTAVPRAPEVVRNEPTGDAVVQMRVHQGQTSWRRYGVIAVAFLVVPVLVYGSVLVTDGRAGGAKFELPPASAPWRGPMTSADPLWQPKFVGADAELRAVYESTDGRTVEVVAIGFPRQTQDAHILDERNSLLGDHGLSFERISMDAAARIPHSEVTALDAHGRRSLIWSVIDIGGHPFAAPLSSQLWYGARSLIGTPYSALFALRSGCEVSCDAARAALAHFLSANGAALIASLPDAKAGV